MRLGIFGGSFDPIHYGHLLLAEACREQCELDRVLFMPAATAPHKQTANATQARHRLEMVELAIAGHAGFATSTLELDRGGVSYTVDTLAATAEQYPEAELFFLMGADSLNELATWRQPERICELAIPVVVARGGEAKPDFSSLAPLTSPERLGEIESHLVQAPLIELSSTEIRERVAGQRSIRFRTPRAVEQYIQTHDLYHSPESRS